jgi:hypothetical protein
MGGQHVGRLGRARDLLSSSFDTSDCVLACYSAAGFTEELRSRRSQSQRPALIGLDEIYG